VQFYYAVSALDKNNNESSAIGPEAITKPLEPLTLASPADQELNYAKGTLLRWYRAAGAVAYRVRLASDSSFSTGTVLLDKTTADTSTSVPALQAQTFYYWDVVAGNEGGAGSPAAFRSFRTGWLLPPTIVSPNGVSNVSRTPTFVWRSNGATTYTLRVTDVTTSADVIYQTVADTTYVSPVTLEGYRIYGWRVMANNACGSSEWSSEGRFRTVSVSPVEDLEEVPSSLTLSPNYPNPFNGSTRIQFGLADAGHVSLRVYDILGREVAVLVDEILPLGTYTATFDASSLPSGTYVYVLTAGGQRMSGRMALIK
jgi:hypothetical protein